MKEKGDKTKTDRYVPEQVLIIILIIVNSMVKMCFWTKQNESIILKSKLSIYWSLLFFSL